MRGATCLSLPSEETWIFLYIAVKCVLTVRGAISNCLAICSSVKHLATRQSTCSSRSVKPSGYLGEGGGFIAAGACKAARACSGVMVRPSLRAAAKAFPPSWVLTLATVRLSYIQPVRPHSGPRCYRVLSLLPRTGALPVGVAPLWQQPELIRRDSNPNQIRF